jgi:basic amino acid/polyamine antiporter, APA family
MAAVTAVTALNTFNGGFITASRFVYGTAREGALPRQLALLNNRAVPWVPVVGLGALSLVVSLLVAVTHAWQVLVAVGASLEAMIYAVAALCTYRLRSRAPDHARPFRIRGARILAVVGLVVFGALSLVASLSVNNKFNVVPLIVIVIGLGLSSLYVLALLPGIRAKEAARQSTTSRRRPARPAPTEGA